MATDINTIDKIREIEKSGKIQDIEQALCKGLLMPFNTCNSGSRKQMFGSQIEQKLELLKAELARVSTGYENRFGDRSSSIIQTDRDLVVVHKISKFSFDPDRFYYLIVYDPSENSFGLIERKSYEHFTETYGVMYNNDFIDAIKEKLNATDVQNQNANMDENSFGGRTGEASSVVTKRLALDYIVSPKSRENHLNNEIYIHDLDAYYVGSHNCLSIPFDDLLAKGFNTR